MGTVTNSLAGSSWSCRARSRITASSIGPANREAISLPTCAALTRRMPSSFDSNSRLLSASNNSVALSTMSRNASLKFSEVVMARLMAARRSKEVFTLVSILLPIARLARFGSSLGARALARDSNGGRYYFILRDFPNGNPRVTDLQRMFAMIMCAATRFDNPNPARHLRAASKIQQYDIVAHIRNFFIANLRHVEEIVQLIQQQASNVF